MWLKWSQTEGRGDKEICVRDLMLRSGSRQEKRAEESLSAGSTLQSLLSQSFTEPSRSDSALY